MSLRHQINLRILLSSLCILLLGGAIAIWQARASVNREDQSAIDLAAQLISLAFTQAAQSSQFPIDWLPQLNILKENLHLSIQLKTPDGQITRFSSNILPIYTEDRPPQWFIQLVESEQQKFQRNLTANGKELTLVILGDPLDEVIEAWQESLAFCNLLLLLTLFTFLAVNLVFNKAFQSIASIVNALKSIESGEYQHKLPELLIEEYDLIAKAINHLTDQLNTSQQENRALTQHSLAIQEDERQKLAQELHDELGQSLAAIKVMAVTCAHPKADIAKITKTITEVCDHLAAVVRTMMHQLHPLTLDELGLKATMEDLVYHWSQRNPTLSVALECDNEVAKLEQKIAIQLFRIVQECLTNTVRHAEASQAHIKMTVNEAAQTVQLIVSDNGRGCEISQTRYGFGLLGMKERVKSLGGELFYRSEPQQGMQVVANIPLTFKI